MFNNTRNSGFKRRGSANRNRFGRPFNKFSNRGFQNNSQNSTSRFGPTNPKGKLGTGDLSIFIKKAAAVTTEESYRPHNSFADFEINEILKRNIIKRGYRWPTPIQDKAIEPILQGKDLIGLANTGTGKTAAFLIPIINKIFQDRSQKALIVAPTRELAAQINEEFKSFTKNMNL